jgi:hypothetical protein
MSELARIRREEIDAWPMKALRQLPKRPGDLNVPVNPAT